jgi:small-conductance mechanosensitive channel
VKVGWRSTWIRTLANNVIVVPNSTMTRTIITNFSLPGTELAVPVAVGVAYDSDLDQVERVTLEIARETMREAGWGGTDPVIRYNAFGDSAVTFNVILHASEFATARALQHDFIKRLLARYRRERIVIPFPIRTLDLPAGIREGLRPQGRPEGWRPRGGE